MEAYYFDGNIHWASGVRTSRFALGGCGSQNNELHVRQRADRYNKIGAPKSASGERTVPFAPIVTNALRELRLARPHGIGIVFTSSRGKILSFDSIDALDSILAAHRYIGNDRTERAVRGQIFRQLLQPAVNDNPSIPSDFSDLIERPIRKGFRRLAGSST